MKTTICTSRWEGDDVTRDTIIIGNGEGKVQIDFLNENNKRFGHTALIWDLYVNERFRRKGIARELMKVALQKVKDYGYDTATLEWELSNTPYEILDWYTRLGFEEKEFGEGCALMVKTIK